MKKIKIVFRDGETKIYQYADMGIGIGNNDLIIINYWQSESNRQNCVARYHFADIKSIDEIPE